MSDVIDWRAQGGIWPLQDHDRSASLVTRSHLAAARIVRSDLDLNLPYEDVEDTRGDVLGGLMVRERDSRRDGLQGWWLTGCPVIAKSTPRGGKTAQRAGPGDEGDWTPAREARERDERFQDLDLEHPIFGGPLAPEEKQLYPGGWTGLVSAGSDEREQRDILHPDFLGIVAPHAGGREQHGTPVWDVDQKGDLDPGRWSRFQRLARVVRLPARAGCMPGAAGRAAGLLAWQIGSALDDTDCGGLVADAPGAGAGDVAAGQMLALMSVRHGGPIDVGGPGDQHILGASEDAEPVDQAHLSRRSIFRGGPWDCGLEFRDETYEPTQPGQVWLETVLRVDPDSKHETACGVYPGLGRWETRGMVYAIPPRRPPPRPPPKPPPKPPPQTTPPFWPVPPGTPGTPTGPGGDDFVFPPTGGRRPRTGTSGPGGGGPRTGTSGPGGGGGSGTGTFPEGDWTWYPTGPSDDSTDAKVGPKPWVPNFGPLDHEKKLWAAASLAPMLVPSLGFRAPNNSTGALDYRRAENLTGAMLADYDTHAPVVAQMLSFVATQGGNYKYGSVPCSPGLWAGGDADGGVLVTPADVDMADPATTSRTTFFGMGPGTTFGFGQPASDGTLVDGWRTAVDSSDNLETTPVDASGAQASSRRQTFNGVLRVGPDNLATDPTLQFGPNGARFQLDNASSLLGLLGGVGFYVFDGGTRRVDIRMTGPESFLGPDDRDTVVSAGGSAAAGWAAELWGGAAAPASGAAGGNVELAPGAGDGAGLRGGVRVGMAATDRLGFFGTAVQARQAVTALGGSAGGAANDALVAVPDPADLPPTADALRDDLVANVLPVIRDDLDDCRAKIETVRAALATYGLLG